MGIGAGLYMYDVVLKMLTFAISSTDQFLLYFVTIGLLYQFAKIPPLSIVTEFLQAFTFSHFFRANFPTKFSASIFEDQISPEWYAVGADICSVC